jgi:hypothetical protein
MRGERNSRLRSRPAPNVHIPATLFEKEKNTPVNVQKKQAENKPSKNEAFQRVKKQKTKNIPYYLY